MSPKIDRPPAPYMQVADHYRRQIQDGTLSEGDRLPAVAAVAREWGIAHATAAKVLSQLQVEGLISTSPRGSFVAAKAHKATSTQERVKRSHETGSVSGQNEHHRVTAAELIDAPSYVADLLDLAPDDRRVVRREFVTIENKAARALTVTWYPAALADAVPDLLSQTNSSVGGLLGLIEDAMGTVRRGRDFYHARGADAREAAALGLPVGASILAGAWLLFSPEDQLLEYGETCLPPYSTVSYPYETPVEEIREGTQDA